MCRGMRNRRMSLINTLIASVLLLVVSETGIEPSQAQERGSVTCKAERVEGVVFHGEVYRAEFGDGLLFRLTPATNPKNPQGWTIQVLSREGGMSDYAAVATPPYRSSNPRYLDTGYGIDAEEAVRWKIREFRFVLGDGDFQRMHAALGTALWPGEHSTEEIAAAKQALWQTGSRSTTA